MTDEEIRKAILTRLSVPMGIARRALSLGQHAANAAAERGAIPTVEGMGRAKPVPTSWLRQVLGLDDKAVS
jgi:hypothetical protein